MRRLVLCFVLIFALVMSVSAFTTASIDDGYSGSGWGVSINCSDKWGGSITGDSTVRKIEGTGGINYTVTKPQLSLSAHIQKLTNSTNMLVVEVLKDGTIIESRNTSLPNGVILIPLSTRNFK